MLGAHPCVQDWLNEDRTAHAKHSFDERVATGNLNVPELTVEAVENSMGNIGHGLRFRLSEAVASNRNMVGKFYTSKYTDKGLARLLYPARDDQGAGTRAHIYSMYAHVCATLLPL